MFFSCKNLIVLALFIEKTLLGTSLVAQCLRICLSMQGTWVRSLAQEDPI